MFSHSGLSSISPSRRRSPDTGATPERIARRRPGGTSRPLGSVTEPCSGRRIPHTSSSTSWWPAPATPARPTISPGATRRLKSCSRPPALTLRISSRPASFPTSSASATCSAQLGVGLLGRLLLRLLGRLAEHRGDDGGDGQALARLGGHRDLAVAQDGDLVAQRHHVLEDVGDEDDADLAVAQDAQDLEQRLGARRAERGGRLVEDQDARLGEQRLADLDELALGEAQLLDRLCGGRRRGRAPRPPAALERSSGRGR